MSKDIRDDIKASVAEASLEHKLLKAMREIEAIVETEMEINRLVVATSGADEPMRDVLRGNAALSLIYRRVKRSLEGLGDE